MALATAVASPAASGVLEVQSPEGVAVKPSAFLGWTASGSGATFRIYDGSDDTGIQLTALRTVGDDGDEMWLGDEAVQVSSGSLYLEVVSGELEIVVYAG